MTRTNWEGACRTASCPAGYTGPCDDTCNSVARTTVLAGGLLVAVPVGAAIGAAVSPGEQWRVADTGELVLQPMASGGGVGVRLTLRF